MFKNGLVHKLGLMLLGIKRHVRVVGVCIAASVIAVGGAPRSAGAQDLGQVISSILVVDREKLFVESAFGQNLLALLSERGAALAAETRQIVADLEAEELSLSQARATLSADDFRALAEVFDTKVQQLREERSLAEEAHLLEIETVRSTFLEQVNPILAALMQEAGAVVLLERRTAILSANSIDITAKAIARIDATLMDEVAPGEGVDTSQ